LVILATAKNSLLRAERLGFSDVVFYNLLTNGQLWRKLLIRSHLGIFICFCLVLFVCSWFNQRLAQNRHKLKRASCEALIFIQRCDIQLLLPGTSSCDVLFRIIRKVRPSTIQQVPPFPKRNRPSSIRTPRVSIPRNSIDYSIGTIQRHTPMIIFDRRRGCGGPLFQIRSERKCDGHDLRWEMSGLRRNKTQGL
jgi:hypothetical protein